MYVMHSFKLQKNMFGTVLLDFTPLTTMKPCIA